MKEKVEINALDHYGRGIGKYYDKTVFVLDALPSEEVLVEITNNKKNYCEAVVREYISKSRDRINPICPYFELCGGCHIMHMDYQKQLEFKKNKVIEIVKKFADIDQSFVKDIVPTNPLYYRNKIVLQVSNKIGFYKEASYEIVNIDSCFIADSRMNQIISRLNKTNLENINQVIIRSSLNTEDIMIVFCIYNRVNDQYLVDEFKDLATSIIKKYKNEEKCLFGKNDILETIKDFKFLISPSSFFQVNTLGMEKLYDLVKKYINPNKNMEVLDLYCGTGTIGIYVSREVKKVYGVEINRSAIKDAIKNANLNDISNIQFKCADVKDVVKNYKNIDVVIVDPPRAGLSKEAINDLMKLKAEKIIYVSCDPITLSRDLHILDSSYSLEEITPVDMFPNTYHVECVSLLSLKRSLKNL